MNSAALRIIRWLRWPGQDIVFLDALGANVAKDLGRGINLTVQMSIGSGMCSGSPVGQIPREKLAGGG
jgi:hypothetical protein